MLGAGVMGSGIAAHLAGAGIEVLLLDIVPPDGKVGAQRVRRGRQGQGAQGQAGGVLHAARRRPHRRRQPRGRSRQAPASAISSSRSSKKISRSSSALFARLEPLLGRAHHRRVEHLGPAHRADDGRARSPSMKKRFLVTHFFNPVRYMKLLEIVAGTDTDPAVVERVARFGEDVLGKGIVLRQGHAELRRQPHRRLRDDAPHQARHRAAATPSRRSTRSSARRWAARSRPCSAPPTRRPRHHHPRRAELLREPDPATSAARTSRCPALLEQMVEKKMLGDKTGGGFMKKTPEGIVTLDLKTMRVSPAAEGEASRRSARPRASATSASASASVLAGDDNARRSGARKRDATRRSAYASNRIGEIADDVVNIDRGMRWGFGWDLGPFETWDAIGVAERPRRDGEARHRARAVGRARCSTSGRTSFYERRHLLGREVEVVEADRRRRRASCRCRRRARRAASSSRTTAPRSTTSATASPASSSTPR